MSFATTTLLQLFPRGREPFALRKTPHMTVNQDIGPSDESIERMIAFAAVLRASENENTREFREAKLRLRELGITINIWKVLR